MRVKIQHSMASDPPEISFEKIQEFQRTWKYVFHHGASPSANWLMGALRQHCDGLDADEQLPSISLLALPLSVEIRWPKLPSCFSIVSWHKSSNLLPLRGVHFYLRQTSVSSPWTSPFKSHPTYKVQSVHAADRSTLS
ncbi:hypothetical protein BDV98DRAFT_280588 [Pterulicium gracile]|uniref:Uncharacterized protein n=1 Tax=Pterulicium gracile TaxID=1884261 RepID=A0A5C3QUB0_9AGAR|nr:hypothetical protein BDV98DRAFT_280588 [Pterula gracilis]